MKNETTCMIELVTKDRMEFAAKCMKMKRKELNTFYSHNYIINRLIEEYLDKINIEPMKDNLSETYLDTQKRVLEKNRIDVNLSKTTKDDLKSFAKALLKKNVVDRKLNYEDIVEFLLKYYLISHPGFADEILEYRYIKQKEALEEFRKKHNVY